MPAPIRHRNQANGKKDAKKPTGKKTTRDEQTPSSTVNPADIGIVYPSGDTAFKALLSARFCAAIWSHISDCDETFNYWEPTHYLLFDKGFQTWEYSPDYALRSYAYILVHVVPAWIYQKVLQPNRMLIFYFCRCLLGLVCAFCEVYFYKSVCREFGVQVGRLVLGFLLLSAGMFVSSTAFLPSSFSMYMTCVALGAWYHRKFELAIFATALSALLSWPFAVIVGIPIALDLLYRRRAFVKFSQWCAISLAVILLPMVCLDSTYFGRLVVAPFNLIKYNVFTSHGPDLYGTEPLTFYFINGFLNFNFVFVGALLTPVVLILVKLLVQSKPRNPACLPYSLSLLPLYLWIAVFFMQPHKEERFLFPIYPCICLCGAVTTDAVQKLYFRFVVRRRSNLDKSSHYLSHTGHIAVTALAVCSLLGVSRIFALYNGYHAPLDVFIDLSNIAATHKLPADQDIKVCVGKEWHRYPSSFFLPNNDFQLHFLRSEFRGQLPQPYSRLPNATTLVPKNMNDMNQEEPTRYFDVERCHFIVDVDYGRETEREPNYSEQRDKWKIIKSVAFLDTARSHQLYRAFYIPFVSNHFCTYVPYNLLQSTRLKLTPKDVPIAK